LDTPASAGENREDMSCDTSIVTIPFVSSIQVNTPSMDALEAGEFRQRVLSGDNEDSEEISEVARPLDTMI